MASGNPMSVGEIKTSGHTLFTAANKNAERVRNLGSCKGASGHDNFLKGVIVQFDVKYPQYWTPEAQRYHWLDIVSSQSKMHRLTTMAKDWESFSKMFNEYTEISSIENVYRLVAMYNEEENPAVKYHLFMKALSNLPMGFEMWETISTNYLQLKTIYNQRKGHKLKDDWGAFTEMCEELPLFMELTQGGTK